MSSRKIGGGFTFCWGWVGGRLGVGRIITVMKSQKIVRLSDFYDEIGGVSAEKYCTFRFA